MMHKRIEPISVYYSDYYGLDEISRNISYKGLRVKSLENEYNYSKYKNHKVAVINMALDLKYLARYKNNLSENAAVHLYQMQERRAALMLGVDESDLIYNYIDTEPVG